MLNEQQPLDPFVIRNINGKRELVGNRKHLLDKTTAIDMVEREVLILN
jgi:hypothetical protein